MREHGITKIATENTVDFENVPAIQAVCPF